MLMPSTIEDFRFASEAGSSTIFEWGVGNSIELCGIGSQPLASQRTWEVPDFASRRVAHATAHLYSESHRKDHGQDAMQQLAVYAAKISQTLLTITGENQITDETSIQIYHERAIWDLLRIFFVDAAYQPCLAQALVAWMRSFYSLYEDVEGGPPLLQEVARLSNQRRAPEDDPAFWPLAQKLLALGWVQEAGELLEGHSVYSTTYAQQQQHPNLLAQHTVMERIARLLQRMPFLGVSPGGVGVAAEATAADVADFMDERREWKEQVRRDLMSDQGLWQRAELQSASTTDGLTQMVAIMCGREEAIGEACTSWPEILIAHLCHTYPDLPLPSSLAVLLDKCLQAKGASDNPSLQTLQDLLSAIGGQEFQSIMQVCSERGSAWLPAHVPDLLLPYPGASAILETPLPHLGYSQVFPHHNLRHHDTIADIALQNISAVGRQLSKALPPPQEMVEFFVLEYASSLAEGPTTWQHALQYYACCPQAGQHAADALIQVQAGRLGQQEASKLLRMAAVLGLEGAKPTICRLQGHKALQEGRLGQALQWFLALDSASLANEGASAFLAQVAETITSHPGELLGVCQPEVLSQLEDLQSMLSQHSGTSDSLGFLQALLQFQLGMHGTKPEDFEKAARALERLLKNSNFMLLESGQKLHPGLALDLLLQGMSLLERNPSVFSVADIEGIRQTLQGMTWRSEVLQPKALQKHSAKLVAVNLLLESALLF